MKIRFLKPENSRFGSWLPGDTEDVDDTEALRLVTAGIAVATDEPAADAGVREGV